RSTLRDQNVIVDEYATSIGIREAAFDADKGLLLNGERVKLNGACVHHDGGCVGAAVPTRVWERRLELLREMGCNAIRTSHNPFAAEFLDLCDRMGFLVMNEIFDEWKSPKGQIGPNGYSKYFEEWYERDVRNFIQRDRNHPSVVIWSAGNEVGDQSDPKGVETLRRLLDVFHSEDPTRPVTVGCDRIESEPASNTVRPEFLALLDVVGYNYADRWRGRRELYYSVDRERFPRRRVVGTESSGMGGVRGDYGYLFGGPSGRGFGGSARGRPIDVEQLWRFVSLHDYVAGDFMWTGIDHIGESFWPGKGSSSGVLDTCGFKKDGFYFYQSQWTDKPMLHLYPHWNWKGREGQFIPVTCYTNCDTVELFLNGRSAGVKGCGFPRLGMEGRYGNYPARAKVLRTTADLHLSWDVPYEAGTLKAIGTRNGEVVATAEVATTGEPSALRVTVDRAAIAADSRDVAHVTVGILDDHGRVVPVTANEIKFQIKGDGNLIGVDNGDPQSHEDYKSDRRRAFNGLCLAIVQSTSKQGQFQVLATSAGLEGGNVTVKTIAPPEKLATIRR
ncbi:MAG TPA: glycoside hydrolase family 2 TIM barrel-domain containing protein, partial [Blastocatellia bacterium]|nr:glycoside hydrolase family 2 TIM barrel-domain containing protein [Blastocatellia bacterium]